MQSEHAQQIILMLGELELANAKRNRPAILELYSKLEEIDWENVDDLLFERYNALVDDANDILYCR